MNILISISIRKTLVYDSFACLLNNKVFSLFLVCMRNHWCIQNMYGYTAATLPTKSHQSPHANQWRRKLVKWASYNSQICITENLPAGVNFSLTGNLLVHKALHTHTILSSKYTCKQKEEMEQIVCHELSPLYLGQWELHFHSTWKLLYFILDFSFISYFHS